MEKIFEIATSISTPIALAGFFGVVFFLIVKQVIAKDIYPRLTKELSSDIFKHIIDKLFILSLIAMLLGFIGYSVSQLIHHENNNPSKITVKPPIIEGLNILIFDAAYSDLYIDVASKLNNISKTAAIDIKNSWKNKHIMKRSRIIFLKSTHISTAKNIAEWLQLKPIFIDYNDQTPERFRKVVHGESLFDKNTFVNIDSDRDIVIFIGEDYGI